jgi:hypothetical protein
MKKMTPREMPDAIDCALEDASRIYSGAVQEREPLPAQIERAKVPIEQMTPRQIFDAIDEALAEASHRFTSDQTKRSGPSSRLSFEMEVSANDGGNRSPSAANEIFRDIFQAGRYLLVPLAAWLRHMSCFFFAALNA